MTIPPAMNRAFPLRPALETLPRRHPRWRPPRLFARAQVAWHAQRLDQDLAAGIAPNCDELHTLRAMQLLAARRRPGIAHGLERAVRDSERPPAFDARAPLQRVAIGADCQALLDLTTRLRDRRPATAHGIALASLLVTDANSPLYRQTPHGTSQTLAHAALTALDQSQRLSPEFTNAHKPDDQPLDERAAAPQLLEPPRRRLIASVSSGRARRPRHARTGGT